MSCSSSGEISSSSSVSRRVGGRGSGHDCGGGGGGGAAHPVCIPASSDNRFEKLSLLGQGSFGEAWLARSTISGRNYVVKEMKMTNALTSKVSGIPKVQCMLSTTATPRFQDRERTFNEVNIIRKCCHVNIIRYKVGEEVRVREAALWS